MVKVEIELEGSPAEVIGALRRIAGERNAGSLPAQPELRQEPPAPEPAAPVNPVTLVPQRLVATNWTLDYTLEFLSGLHPGSLQAIERIYRASSYRIHRGRLAQDLDIPVEQVNKQLVSAGYALRQVHEAHPGISLPQPVKYHPKLQIYSLDDSFAKVFGNSGRQPKD